MTLAVLNFFPSTKSIFLSIQVLILLCLLEVFSFLASFPDLLQWSTQKFSVSLTYQIIERNSLVRLFFSPNLIFCNADQTLGQNTKLLIEKSIIMAHIGHCKHFAGVASSCAHSELQTVVVLVTNKQPTCMFLSSSQRTPVNIVLKIV